MTLHNLKIAWTFMTTLVEQRMGLLTDAKPPPIGHYECPPGHATDRLRTSLMTLVRPPFILLLRCVTMRVCSKTLWAKFISSSEIKWPLEIVQSFKNDLHLCSTYPNKKGVKQSIACTCRNSVVKVAVNAYCFTEEHIIRSGDQSKFRTYQLVGQT